PSRESTLRFSALFSFLPGVIRPKSLTVPRLGKRPRGGLGVGGTGDGSPRSCHSGRATDVTVSGLSAELRGSVRSNSGGHLRPCPKVGDRTSFMNPRRAALLEELLKPLHLGRCPLLIQSQSEGLGPRQGYSVVHGLSARHFDPPGAAVRKEPGPGLDE